MSTIGFAKASMLARDGRCKAFDARADGYVRAEGAVALYVKAMDRAVAEVLVDEFGRVREVVHGTLDGLDDNAYVNAVQGDCTIESEQKVKCEDVPMGQSRTVNFSITPVAESDLPNGEQQVGHARVPRIRKVLRVERALDELLLEFEAQDDVEVVRGLIGFDSNQRRSDVIDCKMKLRKGNVTEC